MTVNQSFSQKSQTVISESSILLTSFVAGLVASILTISILFFTVKKFENKPYTSANIIYTAKK